MGITPKDSLLGKCDQCERGATVRTNILGKTTQTCWDHYLTDPAEETPEVLRIRIAALEAELAKAREIIQSHESNDWHAIADQRSAALIAAGNELAKARLSEELAWGIIANASGGDWSKQSQEWITAAERWRDAWLGRGPFAPQKGGQS